MKNRGKKFLKFLFIFLWFISLNLFSLAEEKPLTVAESSQFTATSRHADVMEFIKELVRQSPLLRVETLCTSTVGREIPFLILGDPPPLSPQALRHDKRSVIYIQANIHAGEVEGKEASLMLARHILLGETHPYLDKLIILIAPIFNADGNEKISPENRRNQLGPEKGVGVRSNGQNLDLNRDCMKMESPEIQGLVQNVLMRWDPLLVVDCHTTNGSIHQEPVTYSWPLNPNGDLSTLVYQREKMLPAINTILKEKYNTSSLPFGDFRDAREPEKGWQTLSHHPRFLTNYIGLRNRLAILNENYAYADYKTRILGCYHFLLSILDYCKDHLEEISHLATEADARTIRRGLEPSEKDSFVVDIEVRPLPEKIIVQGYEMEVIPREGTWPEVKKTDKKRSYIMPYFADFIPKREVPFPFAYLLTISDPEITAKLVQHGLVVDKLLEPATLEVESYRIKEIQAAERLYQGHRLNSVKGEYILEKKEFPEGTLVVRTAQVLGNIAAYLLEPESDDGLMVWNFFDRYIVPQWGRGFENYPVYKLLKPVNLISKTLI